MKSIYVKLYAAIATLTAWHDGSERYEGELFECIEVASSLVKSITQEECVKQYGEELGMQVAAFIAIEMPEETLHLSAEASGLHLTIDQGIRITEMMCKYDFKTSAR